MELTASDIIKLTIDERDKLYRFPYTGPYPDGEPELYEIMERKEHNDIWGSSTLAIYKACPACNSPKAEWVRQEWAICYDCLLAFDAFERYIDLTVEEEMENLEGE